ncbi:MAG: nitroreductase family protein, partial [Phycisphaerae bacterium]
NHVAQASVVVVCCGKKYKNPYNWVGDNLYLVDVAIAIDHMTLAARNEGIGSVWIGAFDHEPIKKLLAVPADHDVVMLLPLGYPATEGAFHTTTERLALDQIVFGEKFGNPLVNS